LTEDDGPAAASAGAGAATGGIGDAKVVRITRLVSRPGRGPELVDRCRAIADRERVHHPAAYRVVQARQPLDGDRVEVVSITYWIDLELMQAYVPAARHTRPAFWDEYADTLESWAVEVFEVTWTTEGGSSEPDGASAAARP
jgi:hypothetical protein